jgi:hypothetical protein
VSGLGGRRRVLFFVESFLHEGKRGEEKKRGRKVLRQRSKEHPLFPIHTQHINVFLSLLIKTLHIFLCRAPPRSSHSSRPRSTRTARAGSSLILSLFRTVFISTLITSPPSHHLSLPFFSYLSSFIPSRPSRFLFHSLSYRPLLSTRQRSLSFFLFSR